MKWTSERPTESGWYWVRFDGKAGIKEQWIWFLEERSDGLWCVLNGFDESEARPLATGKHEERNAEWCPIPEPEEA